MADLRKIKTKFRKFFSSREVSEYTIEICQKFILPFVKEFYGRGLGIDDVLKAFFGIDEREFFYVRAARDFTLPGRIFLAGNRTSRHYGQNLKINKGKVMLLVLDKREETARIEVVHRGKSLNYLLERYEFETMKDWVEVIGAEAGRTRHRNYRP